MIPPGLPIRLVCIRPRVNEIEVVAMTTALATRCPMCHGLSRRIHSHYQRGLRHLPMGNQRVRWVLHARRFFCDTPGCARKVFAERVPGMVEPYARRTVLVDELLEMVACLLGGRTGAKATLRLRLGSWSRDTLLRLVRRGPARIWPTPRVLGVDDWAKRKGQTYGTILCDLETHQVVDLLADRESKTLAEWLATHPGVEVICRDRAGTYAEGCRLGAPNALQVADRFHLLMNLRDAVERSLEKHRSQLRVQVAKGESRTPADLPAGQGNAHTPIPRFNRSYEVTASGMSQIRQQRDAKREVRRVRYQQARDLKAHGMSLRAIGQTLKATQRTVKRFLESNDFPEHARRGANLKPFNPYLRQRWEAGVRNARQLYVEIQDMGYAGCYLEVTRWVQPWRMEELPNPSVNPTPQVAPSVVRVTETRTPRQVAYWFVLPPERLTAEHTRQLRQILASQPRLAQLHELAQAFRSLLLAPSSALSDSAHALEAWIDAVSGYADPALQGFAQGLRRDCQAVQAAIATSHSSGQVEGQINRLKLIKRMMYGRGGLDLLRKRIMFSLT